MKNHSDFLFIINNPQGKFLKLLSVAKEKLFSTHHTSDIKSVCMGFPHQPLQLSGTKWVCYNSIRSFGSDTNYSELAQTPRLGLSPIRLLTSLGAKCSSGSPGSPHFCPTWLQMGGSRDSLKCGTLLEQLTEHRRTLLFARSLLVLYQRTEMNTQVSRHVSQGLGLEHRSFCPCGMWEPQANFTV